MSLTNLQSNNGVSPQAAAVAKEVAGGTKTEKEKKKDKDNYDEKSKPRFINTLNRERSARLAFLQQPSAAVVRSEKAVDKALSTDQVPQMEHPLGIAPQFTIRAEQARV